MNDEMRFENPFTPSFGEMPLYLAGREKVISDLRKAYRSSRRRPELTLSVQGARGTGKTALLSAAAAEASESGWISISVMAMPGLLEDILIQTRRSAAHLLASDSGARISSVGVGELLHIELARERPDAGNWRSEMSDVLDELDNSDIGLLVTVDEVQPSLEEVVQLVATYQLFVREGRKIALVLAGLPHNMSALLNDKSVSFLRRAQACYLGRLDDIDVESAFRKTVERDGRTIEDDALAAMVKASGGFPFMMQLVGYHAWETGLPSKIITGEHAQSGIAIAEREMKERVISATYRSLSDGDRLFLEAMLDDDGDSKIGDIAERLGKTTSYATQYKLRLMRQGVIGERGRGRVGFDLPLMREFLLEIRSFQE